MQCVLVYFLFPICNGVCVVFGTVPLMCRPPATLVRAHIRRRRLHFNFNANIDDRRDLAWGPRPNRKKTTLVVSKPHPTPSPELKT